MSVKTNQKVERKRRVQKMVRALTLLYPDKSSSHTVLNYSNPWELAVAVILSARTTDKKVNEVTSELFVKYPKLSDYAHADSRAFAKDISSLGFFNTKAKHIISSANIVLKNFNGRVPHTMEDLITFPGIARKTANVILWNAYEIISGIPVDTHVRRFAIRFDLTDFTDPTNIEKDLMSMLPKQYWPSFSHHLILYGREHCPARRHDCKTHVLTKLYPKAATVWPKSL